VRLRVAKSPEPFNIVDFAVASANLFFVIRRRTLVLPAAMLVFPAAATVNEVIDCSTKLILMGTCLNGDLLELERVKGIEPSFR